MLIDTDKLITDKANEKIFFGEYSGFQRYDNPSYRFAKEIEEKQRNSFWNPSEISMVNDSIKFFDLPKHIQEIMQSVWLFQTLMDSGQNKGLEEVLANICTSPEFEAMFKTWGYFELIHSLSYSHILRGIFADSSEVFNKIDQIQEIKNRINNEILLYTKVQDLDDIETSEERLRTVVELLLNILALEGIKFYTSFLVTYMINDYYGSKIAGSTRIIKLINFDEDLHTSMCAGLLNILKKEKKEGFYDIINSEWFTDKAKEVFKNVYEDEMKWAEYLLSLGNIPGLTKTVAQGFLKYYTDFRLSQIGIDPLFNAEKTDIVHFFENYKNLNMDNAALQESDLAVYSVGILKNDMPQGKILI